MSEWKAEADPVREADSACETLREALERRAERRTMTNLRDEEGCLIDVERVAADEYDREAQAFMDAFDAFVTKQFGERCPEYEVECSCCKLWVLRDRTKDIVII